jgi:hypothetical protein
VVDRERRWRRDRFLHGWFLGLRRMGRVGESTAYILAWGLGVMEKFCAGFGGAYRLYQNMTSLPFQQHVSAQLRFITYMKGSYVI